MQRFVNLYGKKNEYYPIDNYDDILEKRMNNIIPLMEGNYHFIKIPLLGQSNPHDIARGKTLQYYYVHNNDVLKIFMVKRSRGVLFELY